MLKSVTAVRRLPTSYTYTGKKHLTFCDAYHWEARFGIPLGQIFFFAGRDDKLYWGGHVPPPSPLLCTLILNLFITICLSRFKHALSKLCKQSSSYLVKHSKSGTKTINKICLKIVQKALKWPPQYVNLQTFSGVACPRTT